MPNAKFCVYRGVRVDDAREVGMRIQYHWMQYASRDTAQKRANVLNLHDVVSPFEATIKTFEWQVGECY